MRTVARWLRIFWLRHHVRIFDDAIAEEEERHAEYDRRMRSWHTQRAPYLSELERLQGKIKTLDWHGGCNQAWRKP